MLRTSAGYIFTIEALSAVISHVLVAALPIPNARVSTNQLRITTCAPVVDEKRIPGPVRVAMLTEGGNVGVAPIAYRLKHRLQCLRSECKSSDYQVADFKIHFTFNF